MQTFQQLTIEKPADLLFGVAPEPLKTRRGMILGGGLVYPELNFTLPPMFVDEATMPEVRRQYQQIITGASQRAVEVIPASKAEFIGEMMGAVHTTKFVAADYDL